MRTSLLALAVLASCSSTGLPDIDISHMVPQLVDPGPLQPGQQVSRSQFAGSPVQPQEDGLWYVQMTAPVEVSGTVTQLDEDGTPVDLDEAATVFLEGRSRGNHRSATTESTGDWAMTLLPDVYDVIVAPGSLLGHSVALVLPGETLADDDGARDWTLPARAAVDGRLVDAFGQPVAGMVVTVYEAEEPHTPLGVTAVSDSGGRFAIDVPPGIYDVVAAAPPDGTVPFPPMRLRRQALPLLPGVELRIDFPIVPTPLVRGAVQLPTGTPTQTRLRLDGWVRPLAPGEPFTGGRYVVEFETGPDGRWELPLPRGEYRATAWPRIDDRDLGPADLSFTVRGDVNLVEGVDVRFVDAPPVRVAVLEPGGVLSSGARLELQHEGAPSFALTATADAGGLWVGRLLPGSWRVRARAQPDAATGRVRLARTEGALKVEAGGGILDLSFPPSGEVDGFVYSEGQRGVGDVRVLLRDPETDIVLGEGLTDRADSRGYFRATVAE